MPHECGLTSVVYPRFSKFVNEIVETYHQNHEM